MAFIRRGGRGTRRLIGLVAVGALLLATVSACVVAPPPPAITVSADALPTVQINGVVWSQATVGNTVYATGQFSKARPAGAPQRATDPTRNNLLAYNIVNGQLTSFNHSLNAAGLVAARSPDGRRLYIGGDFTRVDGQWHPGIAAFNTSTGALVSTFSPSFTGGRVRAIAATNGGVYVGGSFTRVNGVQRLQLAALNTNGVLLGWAPQATYGSVLSMVVTPDQQKVVIGGQFATLNTHPVTGMGAVSALTGGTVGWAASQSIRNSGINAGITSLRTDGSQVYGTGFVFGPGGNLEGTFAANPVTGAINWIEDCHGDTYDTYATGSVMYAVSHAHFCANIGGFPQTTPWTFYRATAFTTYKTRTITNNTGGPTYTNWVGKQAPTLLNWFPTLTTGTFTGQNQAAWSVTGNGTYIALGGEFPSVNGTAQQGLVRFAVRSRAPNKVGPRPSTGLTPTLIPSSKTIKVVWKATFDQDDSVLTYKIFRDGNPPSAKPIYTLNVTSSFWSEPVHTFTDTNLASNSKHTYRIFVYDPSGNSNSGSTVTAKAG